MRVPSYNKDNRRTMGNYDPLPKGNYVCKIIQAGEYKSNKGKDMIKIAFDIAEGEYKDFYKKKFEADERQDKKWPGDAIYYMTIPTDNCESYIVDQWDEFWGNIEESNNGYVFDGNEKTIKGKIFGGIFRNEPSQSDSGQVYDHIRLYRTRLAQDVRDGKVTWVPKDKELKRNKNVSSGTDDFMSIPDDSPVDLPF